MGYHTEIYFIVFFYCHWNGIYKTVQYIVLNNILLLKFAVKQVEKSMSKWGWYSRKKRLIILNGVQKRGIIKSLYICNKIYHHHAPSVCIISLFLFIYFSFSILSVILYIYVCNICILCYMLCMMYINIFCMFIYVQIKALKFLIFFYSV